MKLFPFGTDSIRRFKRRLSTHRLLVMALIYVMIISCVMNATGYGNIR